MSGAGASEVESMKGGIAFIMALLAIIASLIPGCLTRPENRPPIASFTAHPRCVNVGEEIVFDASNSTDKDGRIVRYHWDFGDSREDMGVCVAHTFSSGGDYTVTLTVTDNEGKKDRTNLTVHVNEYPVARIDPLPSEAKVLAEVGFSAENSTDPDGSIVSYLWEFGDGTNASGVKARHAFEEIGTFEVKLTVVDDFGASGSASASITIVLRTFEITWAIVRHSLPEISGVSEENSTINKSEALLFENMTAVEFGLTWQDDIRHWLLGQYNDDFMLTVTDPGNNTQYGRSMGGNITLTFSLSEPPSPLTLRARTASEALAEVGDKFATRVGWGNWTAVIWLGDAGGAQDLTGIDLDTGNSWKLEIVYFQYEVIVTEK